MSITIRAGVQQLVIGPISQRSGNYVDSTRQLCVVVIVSLATHDSARPRWRRGGNSSSIDPYLTRSAFGLVNVTSSILGRLLQNLIEASSYFCCDALLEAPAIESAPRHERT
jgi:hypothetical protein